MLDIMKKIKSMRHVLSTAIISSMVSGCAVMNESPFGLNEIPKSTATIQQSASMGNCGSAIGVKEHACGEGVCGGHGTCGAQSSEKE